MATLLSQGLQELLIGVGVGSPIPTFQFTDAQHSPMSIYLSYLADTLVQLTNCTPQVAHESIQWPNEFGDLVVVAPRLRLKDVNASELAIDLKKRFPPSPLFGHPFDDGINLRILFNSGTLARILLPYIIDRGELFGKDNSTGIQYDNGSGDGVPKVVVEFSSPNIGKEFDGTHLRSTIVGAYIASLYESMGWNVVRMNFLGDWGKHIGLLAVGWARFGSEELFEADPLTHLLDVYNNINELFKQEQENAKKLRAEEQDTSAIETQGIWGEKDAFFKKMEDGDPEALAQWKRFREVCISNYTELYARLHISFDNYSGESDVQQETISKVESILKEKAICEDSNEASIIDFKKHASKGLGTAILRYRNGTTSYLLRDIAAVIDRDQEYSFDKMIYVVSAKQDSHFQQLFTSLELMGYSDLANRLQHVSFGKVSVQGSSEMQASGHLLTNVLIQCHTAIGEFLDEDEENAKEFREKYAELSDTLSATALMVEDLSIRRLSNFTFDISKVANTDGYNGLSLQHWYVKLSLRLKGTTVDRDKLASADYAIFEEEEYADVLRLLVRFPDIVKSSFRTLESSTILHYLFQITDLLPALPDQEAETSSQNQAQLAFFESVRQVLENGMRIVGLVPIEL